MPARYVLLAFAVLLTGCSAAPSIRVDESIEDLYLATQNSPNDYVAYYNYGLGLLADEQYDAAFIAFDTATDIQPGLSPAHFAMYVTLYAGDPALRAAALTMQQGVEGETEAEINRALQIQEEELEASGMLDRIAEANGYLERAFAYQPFFDWRVSTVLLKRLPRSLDPDVQLWYIMLYEVLERGFREFAMGRYEDATASLTRTLSILPDVPQAHLIRGLALAQQSKYAEGIRDFERVIALIEDFRSKQIIPMESSTASFYSVIGHAHLALGQPDSAITAFETALLQPTSFDEPYVQLMAHVHLARLYAERDDLIGALREITLVEMAETNDPIVTFEHGIIHMQLQDYETAAASFQRTIDLAPRFATAYVNLGLALENSGHPTEAKDAYAAFLSYAAPTRDERALRLAQSRLAALR